MASLRIARVSSLLRSAPLCTAAVRSASLARPSTHSLRSFFCLSRPVSSPSCSILRPIAVRVLQPARSLFIQTQDTPNPQSLKFLPGRAILTDGGTRDFQSFRAAQAASPLAAKLFQVDGVSGVLLGPDFVAVNIAEGKEWHLVKPEVFAALSEFFTAEPPLPILHNDAAQVASQTADTDSSGTRILETDSEVVAMIKELLETRIRPAVQEDGGDISFRGYDEKTGRVWLQMQGSCVGCPSSSQTLKSGIENMLMHYVPEVTSVDEWKDEVLESVSDKALHELEEKLANAKKDSA